MIDYLYRFPDEATAQNVLADYYDSEYGWKVSGDGFALDPVGILAHGETILEGWHINLRVLDDRPSPAPAYSIQPVNQLRVWMSVPEGFVAPEDFVAPGGVTIDEV
jgi:hypothetical protein